MCKVYFKQSNDIIICEKTQHRTKKLPKKSGSHKINFKATNYFCASSIATAQATVIPTIGLLPAPMRPIISMHSESVEKISFQNIVRNL